MENHEQEHLLALADWEDILGKKTKIYSRLLTDPALAKMMEECSFRHEARKEKLLALACGKTDISGCGSAGTGSVLPLRCVCLLR